MYHNYHKHDHYGNPWMADSVTKPEEYCKRAKELGHTSIFTVNHGITGNVFEWLELSELYDLKMIYGFETYYVPNRFEKDRSNKHLILIAKNNDGVLELNDIMSESHISGFYYRPRIDKELLFSINPKNFIVTSACIAGVWDDTELVCALNRKFGNNFFLEVQSHNIREQREMNKRVLQLSKELKIPIIHANDSHYIYQNDSKYREIFQKAKGSKFTYEEEMVLDYPSEDTIYERYDRQGILTRQQVNESLQNTMIFDECETITLINKDIKLPPISDNPTEELKDLLRNHWLSVRDTIPKEKHQKYLEALRYEMDIIEKTHMENYFLIDYNVVKRGQEVYDGKLTNTGRGCFTGNAFIHTLNGIKQLKDIQIGDKVLTADGTFQSVVNTMQYSIEEDLVEIDHLYGHIKHHMPVCTKEHKILVLRQGQIQWVEAQFLTRDDYVCVPKIDFENTMPKIIDLNDYNSFGFRYDSQFIYEEYDRNKRYNKVINRFIEVDEDFNTFIGLMYGDGYTNSRKETEIGLALNTTNHKYTENYKYFTSIANKLGVPIYENKSKSKNLSQVYIRSKVFTKFIKTELFNSHKDKIKNFNSKWFNQNQENLKALLLGFMLSDGSNKENYNRISFDNISPSLINAYKLLCLATNNGVYYLSVRDGYKDKRGYISNPSYKLRYNPNSKNTRKICERTREDSNYYYLPVKGIRIIPNQKTTVYDLAVQNNHNYLLNNMIVHNSAPSFYTTKSLGLTDIDRVSAPVTLYPTRFMSVERILGTRSLPDLWIIMINIFCMNNIIIPLVASYSDVC